MARTFAPNKVAASFAEKQLFSHLEYSLADTQRYADLYGPGLVLLHVGLWKSFSSIVRDHLRPGDAMLRQIRKTVMADCSILGSDGRMAVKELHAKVKAAPVFGRSSPSDGFDRATLGERLGKNISTMSPSIGDIYTTVVAQCLTGDIGASDWPKEIVPSSADEDSPDDILQDALVKNVVEELRRCII